MACVPRSWRLPCHVPAAPWRTLLTAAMRLQNACVWSCVLNKPAMLAATASADFSCKLWNAISGQELQSWVHGHIVRSAHFSTTTGKLATACHDKCLRVFDTGSLTAEPFVVAGLADAVRSAKFLRNDTSLLVSYASRAGLDVIDVRTGKVAQSLATAAPVTSIDIAHDGATVTTAAGVEVGVYDGESMRQLHRVEALQQVESASLHAAKGQLVVGGRDMWAYMLDFPSGKPVMVRGRPAAQSATSTARCCG